MANTCSTSIVFYSKEKESVERFLNDLKGKLESVHELAREKQCWELAALASMYYPDEDPDQFDARADFDGYEPELDQLGGYWHFYIFQLEAWVAHIGVWNKIVKNFFPGVEIAYIAEESGCGYFAKWDKAPKATFFDARFYVDAILPDPTGNEGEVSYIEEHDYYSVEQVIDVLNSAYGFEIPSEKVRVCTQLREYMDNLLAEKMQEKKYDEELSFYIEEYEEIDPNDFPIKY